MGDGTTVTAGWPLGFCDEVVDTLQRLVETPAGESTDTQPTDTQPPEAPATTDPAPMAQPAPVAEQAPTARSPFQAPNPRPTHGSSTGRAGAELPGRRA